MKQIQIALPTIKLIGVTARTSNAREQDPATAKIGPTVQRYFHQALSEKISHRKKPGTTYCVYTNYESDHTGDYTYFIGEEVSSFDELPEGFETLTISPQSYAKFTTSPGPMPNVVIQAWQEIWNMDATALEGERSYHADFEVYDERASNHAAVVADIYIGVR